MIIKHWCTAEHKHMLSHYSLPKLLLKSFYDQQESVSHQSCVITQNMKFAKRQWESLITKMIFFPFLVISGPWEFVCSCSCKHHHVCVFGYFEMGELYTNIILNVCGTITLLVHVWQAHLQNQLYMFVILTFGVTLHDAFRFTL